MPRINSRAKGAAAERELAALLRSHGWPDARRGCQFQGGPDSPDVAGCPGIHWEAKRVETGQAYVWHDQAVKDSKGKRLPIVAHRRNGQRWLAILNLSDLIDLLKRAGYQDGIAPSQASEPESVTPASSEADRLPDDDGAWLG